ncbi:hypothetical protein ACFYMW_12215 [Streptomyces sp. NPDC006692]|uniref:hypothetical protein n=1 Tax=Streptomyces sp. NPDC006692 TaxID=3364758 RepID=UPI0036BE7DC0
MTVDDEWKPEYWNLAVDLLKKYFGEFPMGPAVTFPTMRTSYPWANHRPRVVDSRVHAKNNDEYHGVERHAWQYHVTVQYTEAYHHFLMAAAMRYDDAQLMGAADAGHSSAIRYCIRHALFNKALAEVLGTGLPWPQPEQFGIDPEQHAKREARAERELDTSFSRQVP